MVQPFSVALGSPQRSADGVVALAGFMEALQVPLVEGRYFTPDDEDRPVIVIDELLAKEVSEGRSALGQTLYVVNAFRGPEPREIVGVVRHVQTQGVRTVGMPQLWMTYATRSPAQLNAVVRAAEPLSVVPAIDRAVQQNGSGRPIRDVYLLSNAVADAFADTRFAVFVLGVFGALALLLTAIGIYGTVAHAMIQRKREIAVRIALGAESTQVLRLAVAEAAAWTAAGAVAGITGAFALTRYLASLLFQVEATDALTFAIVATLLVVIPLAAAALPALRAARVNPMLAMRAE